MKVEYFLNLYTRIFFSRNYKTTTTLLEKKRTNSNIKYHLPASPGFYYLFIFLGKVNANLLPHLSCKKKEHIFLTQTIFLMRN